MELYLVLHGTYALNPVRMERFMELLQALGSVETLNYAEIHMEHDARVCGIVVQNLKFLYTIEIYWWDFGRNDDVFPPQASEPWPNGTVSSERMEDKHIQTIIHALQQHSELDRIALCIPFEYYHRFLPCLHAIPTLQKVTLWLLYIHNQLLPYYPVLADFVRVDSHLDVELCGIEYWHA